MRSFLVVPVLGLGQIVAFASSYYLLGVLADPMARAVGLPTTGLFGALSAAFLVSAVLSPAAGRAIERHGGARILVLAHGVFALVLAGMGLAPNGVVMLAAIAGLGLGMAIGLYGTAFSVLVEIHGQGARRHITAVSLLGALGGGLGWPASRVMVETWDWRAACLAWAALHLIACLPATLAVLPRTPRKPAGLEAAPAEPIAWDSRMVRLAGVFAGGWMAASAMAAHLPRVLADLGLTAETAAWAASLMAGSAVAARLFDLVVIHRAHPLATVRIACLLHPLGALVAVLAGTRLAPALAVGQGAGNGLLSVATGVLPLHVFGPERYGLRQALLLTPARYLQAVAPAAYALALESSVLVALAASSAVFLVMLALTWGLGAKAA